MQRYWAMWLPLLAQHQSCPVRGPEAHLLLPPLDVAWCWFVHRLNPALYNAHCTAWYGHEVHPLNAQQALGFSCGAGSAQGEYTRQVSGTLMLHARSVCACVCVRCVCLCVCKCVCVHMCVFARTTHAVSGPCACLHMDSSSWPLHTLSQCANAVGQMQTRQVHVHGLVAGVGRRIPSRGLPLMAATPRRCPHVPKPSPRPAALGAAP